MVMIQPRDILESPVPVKGVSQEEEMVSFGHAFLIAQRTPKTFKKVIEMTTETERLVFGVDEVGKMLHMSRNLCYRLCREGKLR